MPNTLHRMGDAAECIAARVGVLCSSIALHLKLHWAEFRGNHNRALTIMKEIAMADYAALSAAIAWSISQHQADQKTIAAAQTALAEQQSDVNALTAQLTAEFGSAPAPEQDQSQAAAPVEVDENGNPIAPATE